MEFLETLDRRRSVRAYRHTALDRRRIQIILDAVMLAPSAGDLQAYRVVVVENPKTKSALADAAHGQRFIAQASVVLVFFADPERSVAKYAQRGRLLFALQDATLAAAYAQLSAADLGLASCWVGAFDDDAVVGAVNAPRGLQPIAIVPVGEPLEMPDRPPRRSRKELVVNESF
jgi:nitroreductase